MSDVSNVSESATPVDGQAQAPVLFLTGVEEAIKTLVAAEAANLTAAVAKELADVEINRRVTLLVSAVKKGRQLNDEFNKIKPDDTKYNADGTVKDVAWSKKQIDLKNKAKVILDKFTKAVQTAVEKADFKLLEEQLKSSTTSSSTAPSSDAAS